MSFSLRRSVLHNCIMSNSSCPRILTNREARWGSASPSSAPRTNPKLWSRHAPVWNCWESRPQSRANSSPLSTQSKNNMSLLIGPAADKLIHPSLPLSRAAPASPLIAPQFFVSPESPCPAGFDSFATWTAASWRAAVGSMTPRRLLPPKRPHSSPH
ncbi:hypothetical protein TcCL_Unassigned02185 [Trypanosoma cruzi]|nr:hypothetical protein TcCL_Unassigned02185 [Trypanosoma cruzi]